MKTAQRIVNRYVRFEEWRKSRHINEFSRDKRRTYHPADVDRRLFGIKNRVEGINPKSIEIFSFLPRLYRSVLGLFLLAPLRASNALYISQNLATFSDIFLLS